MRSRSTLLPFIILSVFCGSATAQTQPWSPVSNATISAEVFQNQYQPAIYRSFQLNEAMLRNAVAAAPLEGTVSVSASPVTIGLPAQDGSIEYYRVVESPVLEKGLADRYPMIRTYLGAGIDRAGAVVRFDLSPTGFHASIVSPDRKTIYINTVDRQNGHCIVFNRDGMQQIAGDFDCKTGDIFEKSAIDASALGADDGIRRTFRLAVTVTGEYAAACLNGTETSDAERKAKVLSVLTTNLNRANQVFDRDFGVRLNFVTGMESIIFLNAITDPFPDNDATWNSDAQTTIDNNIGFTNYDVGHLIAKVPLNGENGNAGCIGCVCKTEKGSGYTAHSSVQGDPLVIDVWIHELGHQFGANHTHTFFMNEGTGAQMEPGSGSTVMGYAGITGSTDVQNHADDYFHAKSIDQVTFYLKSPSGATCAVNTFTGNNPPAVNAGADYTIPKATPFVLTGQGTDIDGNVLTYSWEQYDAFNWGSSNTFPQPTSANGPVFRSMMFSALNQRTFPAMSTVLGGSTASTWEALPAVGRTMKFRLTVRDNAIAGGANNADDMQVTVDGNSGPFAITSPNSATTWTAGEFRTITWDVAGTNSGAVNCANVAIELSTDGGFMYPVIFLASTPNDGSQEIIVPNNVTSTARIRVRGVGNIFFDVSNVNFSIQAASSASFAFSNPDPVTACSGSSFATTLNTAAVLGHASAINLSASGNPAGTTVAFSASSVNPGNSVTVTLQGSAPAGSHTVTITGTSGSIVKTRNVIFNVVSPSATASLNQPADNATAQPATPAFSWSALTGASSYTLELATNASFSPLATSVTGLTGTSHTLSSSLVSNTQYYWRVKANTVCGTSTSAARQFTTAGFSCGSPASSDVPKAIAAATPNTISSTLNIPGNGTITDVDVIGLAGTHEYISDIAIKLHSPLGTQVILFDQVCDDEQNFNLNLDDAATITTFPCPPVGGLTIKPQSPLANFNGQNCNGTWTLVVNDNFSQDGGSLQSWGLKICLSSGSLPVSWLNFTATRNNKAVMVQWSTAAEINNRHFEIQRSSDGINFLSIGQVNAGGAPSGVQQYLFNDMQPFSGTNYYRLKQVDKDGKFAYSSVATVQMPSNKTMYTLSPNPASSQVRLQFHSKMEQASVRIIDLNGKTVYQLNKTLINAGEILQLPLQGFARGYYLVAIETATDRFREKLIVQ